MKSAVSLLSVLPFAVLAQDTPSRLCSSISGLSISQLESESITDNYVVNSIIVNDGGENATYTVSKCEHETDDLNLVFYGTYFVNPDDPAAISGFGCNANYQGVECVCTSCSFTNKPLVIDDLFLWYDCSGINDPYTCSESNADACSNQVGEQTYDSCFIAPPTTAPTSAPTSGGTLVTGRCGVGGGAFIQSVILVSWVVSMFLLF